MSNPDQFQLVRDPPPIGANPMLEEAYESCQPNGRYDTDDYHDWIVDTYNTLWAQANAAHYTLCIQGHWNPIAGDRIPDHTWDLYYHDAAWAR